MRGGGWGTGIKVGGIKCRHLNGNKLGVCAKRREHLAGPGIWVAPDGWA